MAVGVFHYKPSGSGSDSGSASAANANNTTDAQTKLSNSTSPSPSQATATAKRPTRNQYAKAGWGSRMNFQHSYLLKPGDDDDWEEGNKILDAMIDDEMESRQIDAQEGDGGK